MPSAATILAWLTALPEATLLTAMALLAAVENIFPPIPADVLVALGGFISARGGRSAWPPFLAIWIGNVAGAALMYWLGRRFGSSWTEKRFHLGKGGEADARLLALHARYGLAAFFVSRFLPGVRSVVPAVAGALRIPLPGALAAIALASALWYGLVTWVAYHAGSNWETLAGTIGMWGRWTGGLAALLLLAGAGLWWRRRRAQAR